MHPQEKKFLELMARYHALTQPEEDPNIVIECGPYSVEVRGGTVDQSADVIDQLINDELVPLEHVTGIYMSKEVFEQVFNDLIDVDEEEMEGYIAEVENLHAENKDLTLHCDDLFSCLISALEEQATDKARIKVLEARITEINTSRNGALDMAYTAAVQLRELQQRGFWARVFNK